MSTTEFYILWELFGTAVTVGTFWNHRPFGWWWLVMPMFGAIWPMIVIQYYRPTKH